ncbi:MAG: GNAT family N-acetyltransferase [Ornithinimicrobium sp.]|uniref:GNAT family N-acetyltransferase n=1 Tax=Ornithinimicrobium sp. TaxID=1977084 RepID=UPI0026DF61EA|nr:GNAT family N-acetyltransferase [Ornithinimicrobium sp.]MDO5740548.1 GNAT family N-acetyltransferase [Ornithinimicrobium sp.]
MRRSEQAQDGVDWYVLRLGPQDWRDYRDLRLAMLSDAPDAFWTRLADLQPLTEADWRARSTDRTLHVRGADGRPVGTLTLLTPDPAKLPGLRADDALVLALYVIPAARGRGAVDVLLDAAQALAQGELGAGRLVLHVNEHNARGVAVYRRHGYEFTGGALPHPRQPGVRDLEMAKALTQ